MTENNEKDLILTCAICINKMMMFVLHLNINFFFIMDVYIVSFQKYEK